MSADASLASHAVAEFMTNDLAIRDSSLNLLLKIIDNLQVNVEAYGALRTAKVMPRLQGVKGAVDILRSIGFEEDGEFFLIKEHPERAQERARHMRSWLTDACNKQGARERELYHKMEENEKIRSEARAVREQKEKERAAMRGRIAADQKARHERHIYASDK